MIYALSVSIYEKNINSIVINTNGVFYEVHVSLNTNSLTPNVGEEIFIYTYLQAKEDGITLFGFSKIEEKKLFLLLIQASGIGPKMAIKILGGVGQDMLQDAIATGDHHLLKSIPGIGAKMAQRIVVELKDKFKDSVISGENASGDLNDVKSDVVAALVNLGYKIADGRKIVEKLDSTSDFETMLKVALNKLSGN